MGGLGGDPDDWVENGVVSEEEHSGHDSLSEVVDINQEEGRPLDGALGYTLVD